MTSSTAIIEFMDRVSPFFPFIIAIALVVIFLGIICLLSKNKCNGGFGE